tara:strand:+ start:168 stop:758 length:591 start_codon:yes stop_codon:yes gene_type:complete
MKVNTMQTMTIYSIFIVSIAFLVAFVIQLIVLMPLELALTNENTAFASLLFLPHAVRVIAAWLIGPKSLFGIIPAGLAVTFFIEPPSTGGHELFLKLAASIYASSSAVLAFEFMKFCRIDVYPKDGVSIDWRTVFFAGVFASIINSLGSTWLKHQRFESNEVMEVISRFIIGDTTGLLLGMLTLMLLMRYLHLNKT